MSLSHFRYPFDVVHRPTLEPEVKRAIMASWASESARKPVFETPQDPDEWTRCRRLRIAR